MQSKLASVSVSSRTQKRQNSDCLNMSPKNQVIGSMPVENLPVKRKRGRPRKDESLRRVKVPAVETPGPDPVQRSTFGNEDPNSNGRDAMLGVAVSGFIEGVFEAGYVIKVKVGETNTFLRGVVFDSKLVLPISEANDVASNINMVKRNETAIAILPISEANDVASNINMVKRNETALAILPISEGNDVASNINMVKSNETAEAIPNQLQNSACRVEQTNVLADKLLQPPPLNIAPSVNQLFVSAPLPPSQTQSSTPPALKGVRFDINQVPQASPLRQAETTTTISAHVPSGGQENDVRRALQLPSQSPNQNPFGSEVLQSAEIFSSRVAPINGRDETKTQLKPGAVLEMSQGNETSSKIAEAPYQVVLKISEPNQTTGGTSKVQVVDLNDTPVDGAVDFLAAEASTDLTMKQKDVEANRICGPSGTQRATSELVPELTKTAEANHTQPPREISIKVEISLLNGGTS